MKIKTKKQLNLPQLIEWAWDNNVKGEFFSIDKNEESGIYFATNNDFMMKNADYIRYNNTFTVEVDEEIDEDTKLDLVERFIGGMGYACYTSHGNMTIRECLKRSPEECTTTHFYIENDNRELVLIWQDGNLI